MTTGLPQARQRSSPTPTHPQGGQPPPPRNGANPPWLSRLIEILTLIASGLILLSNGDNSLDWVLPAVEGLRIAHQAYKLRKAGDSRWWYVGERAVWLLIRLLLT
jgi:hypothetical protein